MAEQAEQSILLDNAVGMISISMQQNYCCPCRMKEGWKIPDFLDHSLVTSAFNQTNMSQCANEYFTLIYHYLKFQMVEDWYSIFYNLVEWAV